MYDYNYAIKQKKEEGGEWIQWIDFITPEENERLTKRKP